MGCDISALFDRLFPLWGVCDFPPQEALLRRGQATERAVQVAVAAFPYLLPEAQYAGRNIARYAVVRDYHTVCGARLAEACRTLGEQYPGASFAWYCDNSPLPEVALAEEAGLGRRGLHNLLITEEFGSWIFLGELTATITLPRNAHQTCVGAAVGCMECRRCIEACPTGALGAGEFDRKRCLSFLSQK
ncbi:MAG: DUF1730 domain-containing protein, partial [Oscillospiraceae bacterium]|nr:DUF1730 domain-containing protein [Oscillospiraceae bacterium]